MSDRYQIAVHGCDDSTIIETTLTNDEAEFLKRIAEAITRASSYQCMPVMYVALANAGDGG